jgi:hypothetical protein
MPHWRLLIPTRYVSFADLRGRDVVATIESVSREEMVEKDKKTKKTRKVKRAVVRFVGEEKGMVLKATNAGTIVDLYGTETENWIGKQITLFPTTCSAFGKSGVECVRIRPEVPPPPKSRNQQADEPIDGANQ